ncbi:ADP-ribosylglycohydrolase family protein [Kribbella sp. NPDC048915]|uniref:ADP-ribosylglycohydrolase family protein n=1 Tax=Kribbella sp. NPDC048915 TaxID=3155148 RepID=UPI0033E91429
MTDQPVQLGSGYASRRYDAMQPTDLLADEVRQRRETGYDVDEIVREANRTDPADRTAVLGLVDRMTQATRRPDWPYVEPDALADIDATLTARPTLTAVPESRLADKIHAGWLGRIAGCNVGKPVESGDYWTSDRIREYLTRADAYPLRDYVPVLDPMPDGFRLVDCWPQTTRGNVKGSARDDDIDYAILALHLLETHGSALRPQHVGAAWTRLFPIGQVFTAERAAYLNLVNGFTVPEVARRRNPYREWIGAQIRGDVFGYVHAGNPWAAAQLSYQDASLSHTGNGIYGEMWAAALVAAAFTASSPREMVERATGVVPPESRLAEALRAVLTLEADGVAWKDALKVIQERYGHYSWVHTINNAAIVAAALLWSDGDYLTGVGRVVMSGWDTDSNGATVGSILGVLTGTKGLPEHLIAPLEDRTRSALFGFDNSRISDLADRTVQLAVRGLE